MKSEGSKEAFINFPSSTCSAPLLHPEIFVFFQFHVHHIVLLFSHMDILPGGCRRSSRDTDTDICSHVQNLQNM